MAQFVDHASFDVLPLMFEGETGVNWPCDVMEPRYRMRVLVCYLCKVWWSAPRRTEEDYPSGTIKPTTCRLAKEMNDAYNGILHAGRTSQRNGCIDRNGGTRNPGPSETLQSRRTLASRSRSPRPGSSAVLQIFGEAAEQLILVRVAPGSAVKIRLFVEINNFIDIGSRLVIFRARGVGLGGSGEKT
jgi:hypothetical protein